MTRNKLLTTIATVAIIAAGPALAKPGGGGGEGHGRGNMGADVGRSMDRAMDRINNAGGAKSRVDSSMDTGSTTRIRGMDRISTSSMANNKLTGVNTGINVIDTSGATVGTVTGVSTRGNGTVRNVQVTLTDGTIIMLSPRSLTLTNGVLTTTSTTTNANALNRRVNSQGAAHANVQGLVHASPNSALASAGVTTLTGIATGLTVNNSGGTSIGTVDSILTNRTGAVVGIRVDLTGGGTVFIPATTLTMNGTTVVTSSTNF